MADQSPRARSIASATARAMRGDRVTYLVGSEATLRRVLSSQCGLRMVSAGVSVRVMDGWYFRDAGRGATGRVVLTDPALNAEYLRRWRARAEVAR